MEKNGQVHKIIAVLVCISMVNFQAMPSSFSAEPILNDQQQYTPVQTVEEANQEPVSSGQIVTSDTTVLPDFLMDDSPLSAPVAAPALKEVRTLVVRQDGTGDYATIQAAANAAQFGDTILISEGTYQERVNVVNSGTIDSRITFKADGNVVMQGFDVVNKSYVTLDGFEITNTAANQNGIVLNNAPGAEILNNHIHHTSGTASVLGMGIYVASSDGTQIAGNILDHIAGMGIRVHYQVPSNNVLIKDNTIAYCGLGAGDGAGIQAAGDNIVIDHNYISHVTDFIYLASGSYGVIRNNQFHDVLVSDWTTSPHIDGIQGYVSHVLVENNVMYNVSESGSNVHFALFGDSKGTGQSHAILRYNTVNGIDSAFLIAQDGYDDVFVYNNTVVKTNQTTGVYNSAIGYSGVSTGGNVLNNLFYDAVGIGNNLYSFRDDSLLNARVDYNLAYNSTCGTACGDWIEGYLAPAGTDANGIRNEDPLFQSYTVDGDYASDDFSLQGNSPALNAGGALTAVSASDAGSGATLVVNNAGFFQDARNMQAMGVQADWIAIGNSGNASQILSIDYATNTITLASPIQRNAGDPVYLFKNSKGEQVFYGEKPDIGAYEYVSSTPSNTAPVAVAPTIPAFDEDVPQTITLSGTDADGDVLSYIVVTQPEHGTLTADPEDSSKYIYTPAANYNGTDSFTYKVNDGTEDSNVATVSLTVNAVNDRPVLDGIANKTGTAGQELSFTLSGSDVDGQALTYQIVRDLPEGATLDPQTGLFTWTPTAAGEYTLQFKAFDGTAYSDPQDVVIIAAEDITEETDWIYDWSERTDRYGMASGIFDETPFSITEGTTEYSIQTDEGIRTYYLGTKIFVDGTAGDDANDGLSKNSAFKTIAQAIKNAPAGNVTILVRAGVYTEAISLKSGLDDTHRFMVTGYGQERPIINYESPVLTGSYGPYAQSASVTASGSCSFATIQRVKIQDNYGSGIRFNTDDTHMNVIDVWLYNNAKYYMPAQKPLADGNLYFLGSSNNWIYHTTSEHTYAHGFKVGDGASDTVLEWSIAKDSGYWDNFSDPEGNPITSYYSSSATGIDFPNDLGDSNGDGQPDRGENNIIRYNIVDTALYYGVQIRRCPNFSFHDNEVFNTNQFDAVDMSVKGVARRQVAILYEDTYGDVYNNVIRDPGSLDTAAVFVSVANNATPREVNIYNNIIYGGERSVGALSYGGVDTSGIHISSSTNVSINVFNNSLYANNAASLLLSSNPKPANTTLSVKNNIFYQAGTGRCVNFNGYSNWSEHANNLYYGLLGSVTLNPSEIQANAASNPPWIKVPSGAFQPDFMNLLENSPARDNGANLSGIFDIDFSGKIRSAIGAWDIGAYDYVSETPPQNQAPVAITPTVPAFNEDSTQTITLSGTDADGDALTYIIVTQPEHGTLTVDPEDASKYIYTLEADYNGEDSFTYKVKDGTEDSNVATVLLTVNPINDASVVQTAAFTGSEDTVIAGRVSGTDQDGDSLTYRLVVDALEGLVFNQDGSFSYTPAKDFSGEVSFQYQANDGLVDSEAAVVTLTIDPVNDAPVILDVLLTGVEDQLLPGSVTGTDADGDVPTYRVVGTIPEGLTFNQDGTFSYQPVANFFGTVTFDYVASDGLTDSEAARVTMNIDPVNDIPVANAMAVSTDEDFAGTFTLTGMDADGDQLIYSIVDEPSYGTLSCSGAVCTYTPNADYNGTDAVSFRVFDGTVYSEAATISITVNPVNDVPVLNTIGNQLADEGMNLSFIVTGADLDGDDLVFSAEGLPEGALFDPQTGVFEWTPADGQDGEHTLIFSVTDGVETVTETVMITVSDTIVPPPNEVPVARGLAVSLNEDASQTITLSGTDADGDALTYFTVDQPQHGTLTADPNDSSKYIYTPEANYNGEDSFTYKVNDGTEDSNVATGNLTINAVNDAPVLETISSQTVYAGSELRVPLFVNDVDGSELTITGFNLPEGAVVENGYFSWTPGTEEIGNRTITLQASDGELFSEQSFRVSVLRIYTGRWPNLQKNPRFLSLASRASYVSLTDEDDDKKKKKTTPILYYETSAVN